MCHPRARPIGDRDTADVGLLTYLLASGPDRIGALDFQESPEVYSPRAGGAPLEQLIEAADRVQSGQELPEELDRALLSGSSVGGARPEALLHDEGRALIAKFSAPSDTFPWLAAEAVAMGLAARAGLDVARTRLTRSMGHDVLLVDRFDRVPGTRQRRMIVSALTVLGLHEMLVRHGSYAELADNIRHRFTAPSDTLRELFARIVFNGGVGRASSHSGSPVAPRDLQPLGVRGVPARIGTTAACGWKARAFPTGQLAVTGAMSSDSVREADDD